jgi:NADPH:quinone reductase-like Zn-dependent oxidoreductase
MAEKTMEHQETMQAVFCTKYGPPEVLQIKNTKKPIPKSNEILIKIKATAVNSGDVRVRSLTVNGFMRIVMKIVLGFFGPRKQILGTVYSGIVVKVGKKVKLFKPGDEVFGMTGFKFGAYAEYLVTKENSSITLKPLKASFEEAAAILFGGSTASYFLWKANIDASANKKVLIYGATGSVGTSAIQISKHYNALVTAVCSRENFDLVKSLGAGEVLDYMDDNFKNSVEKYDIIFDAVGKIKQKDWSQFLSQDGIFISVGHLDVASETKEQLVFLKDLFDTNQLNAVIDRTYNFEEMVEAHRYVDTLRKKGNLVVRVDGELL